MSFAEEIRQSINDAYAVEMQVLGEPGVDIKRLVGSNARMISVLGEAIVRIAEHIDVQ